MSADLLSAVSLRTAHGARRAEAVLLRQALERLRELRRREDFSRPLIIVVPSQSLRLHLMGRLVEEADGSLVGIRCTTHFGLALDIAERTGVDAPWDLDLFAILARRFARSEPALADALEHLREGYSGILGAVRDLLDAGFGGEHLEALEEALALEGREVASQREIDRASALARVAARVLVSFGELDVGRTSTLLQAATGAVRTRADEALVTAGVLLHGFADATGVTSDFLEALLRAYGGGAVIDRPPDPVVEGSVDPSCVFARRMEERLSAVASPVEEQEFAPPPRLDLFRALGQEAEVREVAHRCLDLIEAGATPESIGIVMREPAPYVTLLRGVLTDLALPFSTIGLKGPSTPVGRRLRAGVELAMSGGRAHVERWLDALAERQDQVPLFDVRIALASLGVSRIEQLVALDLDPLLVNDAYPLPVRQGFFEVEEEGEGAGLVRSRRRRVPASALRALLADARELSALLDGWLGANMPLSDHVTRMEALCELLGWSAESSEGREMSRLLASIAASPPVLVDQDEFVLTLRRLCADCARDEIGGRGGGVQVMGVVDARARTFEHIFLLGMNRGVFPRTIREDAVLSDPLRKLLERDGHGLLPDLPIKRRGHEEERYLFAQLLSSSPFVTLSWLERDDADRPMPPSPLVERLRWCHPDRPESWRSAPLTGRNPVIDLGPDERPDMGRLERLPIAQQGVVAALYGRSERLPELYGPVLDRVSRAVSGLDSGRIGALRMATLEELDPSRGAAARDPLSPYLGFIGPAGPAGDPRANRVVYITALERMAACPWQTFLERLLRVEAIPDPLDALPSIDPLLIGSLVHGVLERVIVEAGTARAGELEDLAGVVPLEVVWPDEARREELVLEEAARAVRSAGIALDGFDRALAAVAHPYLEVARAMDWPDGTLVSLAAEVEGDVELASDDRSGRRLAFRADRADPRGEGLLLTDYKTGASPFTQSTPKFRRNKLLKEVRAGQRLQPLLYSRMPTPEPSTGRFSFLRPDLDVDLAGRSIEAEIADRDLQEAFDRSISTILRAWDLGLFFPRMELPGESQRVPRDCRWCRVAEACLRQDSGVRQRLRDGIAELGLSSPATRSGDDDFVDALLDHWWLPSAGGRPGKAS